MSLKELKEKVENKVMTAAAKSLGAYSKVWHSFDVYVGEKTGKSMTDRIVEHDEKETKLKEENPLLWAAKKVGEGTLKGIFGSMF